MAMTGSSEAPDVMAELLLDIACQNKFTPFKRIRLPPPDITNLITTLLKGRNS